MEKIAFFFIDDVIWVFRDLTRQRPASLFDNPFMSMLKENHDKYGLTVQLNIFYRTDFFYGDDEFTLSDMTDAYKSEFEANTDWLRLAFHAKQEFPDYPYVNATYNDVKNNYEAVTAEIKRFAGEGSIANILVPHWLPVSREGCRALADCGVRLTGCTYGKREEYTGDQSVLPYGHAQRLLNNRQPETKLFIRRTRDTRIKASICGQNHLSEEDYESTRLKNASVLDEATGLRYGCIAGGPCLNLYADGEDVRTTLEKIIADGVEYIGCATHEQYFYPDYFAYQPNTPEKFEAMSKTLFEAGYRFVTADELK